MSLPNMNGHQREELQRIRKPQVNGSNPFGGSTPLPNIRLLNVTGTKKSWVARGPFVPSVPNSGVITPALLPPVWFR
jgi:hypothetical protein